MKKVYKNKNNNDYDNLYKSYRGVGPNGRTRTNRMKKLIEEARKG